MFGLLVFGSFLLIARASNPCISVSNRFWLDVCDYNAHKCYISSSICPPYGSLPDLLSPSSAGAVLRPSESRPWIIYVDPYNRTQESSSACSTGGNTNASLCIEEIKKSTLDTQKILNTWDWIYLKSPLSYITITTAVSNVPNTIELSAQTAIRNIAFPKCRVFEFTGHDVHLEHFTINIGECMRALATPEQYYGDDGVMVAFSGPDARNSRVESVSFTGVANAWPATTSIRLGEEDGKSITCFIWHVNKTNIHVIIGNVIKTDNFTVSATTHTDTASAISAWFYSTEENSPMVWTLLSSECTAGPCNVFFQQAYLDTPNISIVGDGIRQYGIYNISGLKPSRDSVHTGGSSGYCGPCVCGTVYKHLELFGYITLSLFFLVVLFIIGHQIIEMWEDSHLAHIKRLQ